MSRCATTGVGLICLAKDGRLKFSVAGETAGNVAVRKRQYALSDDEKLRVAKLLLVCKLRGQSENMRRMLHNHPEKVDSLFYV